MIKKKHFYLLLLIFCVLSYSWIIVNLLSYNTKEYSLTVCTLKKISGIPCASCGTTRSILFFFKGDFVNALFYNPIGILVALILIILPLFISYDLITKKDILYSKYLKFTLNKTFWIIIISIFILSWCWNLFKYFNSFDI